MLVEYKEVVLSLILKAAFLAYAAHSSLEDSIKTQPFFMTKFHDYERIREAHYFIDHG
jgi:hypothetical protein